MGWGVRVEQVHVGGRYVCRKYRSGVHVLELQVGGMCREHGAIGNRYTESKFYIF